MPVDDIAAEKNSFRNPTYAFPATGFFALLILGIIGVNMLANKFGVQEPSIQEMEMLCAMRLQEKQKKVEEKKTQ